MCEKYILFNTVPEREDDVLCELMKISELKDICFLFGEYDLLATMETENEPDPSEERGYDEKNTQDRGCKID